MRVVSRRLLFERFSTSKALQGTLSEKCMQLEDMYGCHNYHPLPVVVSRGEGPFVWDAEGCYVVFI